MTLYKYKAFDPVTVQVITNEDEFQDPQELLATLRTDRKILLSYKPIKPILPRRHRKKVSRPEMAEFCRNLSFLISAGVPILQGLEDLAEMSEHKGLAKAIKRVIRNIRNGLSLSESLELSRDIFPPIVRNLASIGEATGKLDVTMAEAATHLMRVHDIITQSNRAMIYPAFVVTSIGIALVVWFFYVLPKIFQVFQDMHIKLPLPTRILMEVVRILKEYWFLAPAIMVLVVVWVILARTYEPIGYQT
jgi:type II secretory pathway component PulF